MGLRGGSLLPPGAGLRVGRSRAVVAALFSAALVAATLAGAPVAALVAARVPGAAHFVEVGALARVPRTARPLGALAPARTMSVGIALRPRDPAGLAEYAAAVGDPQSPLYRRYLSPQRLDALFGPSEATVARVASEFRAAGLVVGDIPANHLIIPLRGPAGRVERVFRAPIEAYRLASGQLAWAAAAPPQVPADVAPAIAAVLGLDDLSVPHALALRSAVRHAVPGRAAPGVATSAAPRACGAASTAATAGSGWTDAQVAQAYGMTGLYRAGDLASGQTIALYELEPFALSDVAVFDRCVFGADHSDQVSTVALDGFDLSGSGSGEAALDVENLSALAPEARILVYEAPNTAFGAIDEYNAIVSQDRANIVSTSWGECEAALATGAPGAEGVENSLFEEAAAQGQTVISAAGDTGSDDCASTPFSSTKAVQPYLSVDDPAAQPYVLGVGGTSLASDVQPLSGKDETVWNDGASAGGGGGGYSSIWPIPPWQAASGVPGVASSGWREVPDVSASADQYRGMSVYVAPSAGVGPGRDPGSSAGWSTIGGTSSAAPVWAAVLAEIAASGSTGTSCAGLPVTAGGADLGFVPPELYRVAAGNYTASFTNITRGNNDVFGLGTGYSAAPGYNTASGLGSPIVTERGQPALAAALCAVASGTSAGLAPVPEVRSLSPTSGPTSGGGSLTIELAAALPAGASPRVQVGGSPATVTSASGNTIVVTLPPALTTPGSAAFSGAGRADVSVSVPGAQGAATSAVNPGAVFEYLDESGGSALPTVTGVGPSGGDPGGGNPVTVYGSGFSAGPVAVSFGGVPASGVKVVNDDQLTATVPPQSGATTCASGPGFDPVDACQVEVAVSSANGTSPAATILPALSGAVVFSPQGVIEPTPETEVAPAASEYDYAPAPVISAITPDPADASGATPVTITGSGFNLDTFEWVNFGSPQNGSDEQVKISSISGDSIEIDPPAAGGRGYSALPGGVSVQTTSGLSNVLPFGYAGTPSVSRLSRRSGPATGGSLLRISGDGLEGVTAVDFVSQGSASLFATAVSTVIVRDSPRSLTVVAPAALAGPVDVQPCTPSGCSRADPSRDGFVFYSVAPPVLVSTSPASGPASGGTIVTLRGQNLAGAIAVQFGSSGTASFAPVHREPIGDPFGLAVHAPPGRGGATVPITVTTFAGRTARSQRFSFRYTPSAPSAPRALRVRFAGTGATLGFTAPASDGGSPITGYQASVAAPGAARQSETVAPGARLAVFSHMLAGLSYEFTLAASNAASGAGSAASTGPWPDPYAADGYRLVSASGQVAGFGSLGTLGAASVPGGDVVTAAAATRSGDGYWLATASGTVQAFGDAVNYGYLHAKGRVVAMAAPGAGDGYWLATASGAVYAFGRAAVLAPAPGQTGERSGLVAMAAQPSGDGYWLAFADGRVLGFGDARSTLCGPATSVTSPAVAIASTPDGLGYWLVRADGSVSTCGDAARLGSPDAATMAGRVVGFAPTPDGDGYWMTTDLGAVYAFGTAHPEGGAVGAGLGPVVAIVGVAPGGKP